MNPLKKKSKKGDHHPSIICWSTNTWCPASPQHAFLQDAEAEIQMLADLSLHGFQPVPGLLPSYMTIAWQWQSLNWVHSLIPTSRWILMDIENFTKNVCPTRESSYMAFKTLSLKLFIFWIHIYLVLYVTDHSIIKKFLNIKFTKSVKIMSPFLKVIKLETFKIKSRLIITSIKFCPVIISYWWIEEI